MHTVFPLLRITEFQTTTVASESVEKMDTNDEILTLCQAKHWQDMASRITLNE